MTTSDTEFIRSAMPLCASLEMEADTVSPEHVVLRLDWEHRWLSRSGEADSLIKVLSGGLSPLKPQPKCWTSTEPIFLPAATANW